MQRTEVLGTVRDPDGVPSAEIDGVVTSIVTPAGKLQVLTKSEAIAWAAKGYLWCRGPGGHQVEIEPVDRDRDGHYDYIRTKPDRTQTNNLLMLDIWDRNRGIWLDYQGRVKAA